MPASAQSANCHLWTMDVSRKHRPGSKRCSTCLQQRYICMACSMSKVFVVRLLLLPAECAWQRSSAAPTCNRKHPVLRLPVPSSRFGEVHFLFAKAHAGEPSLLTVCYSGVPAISTFPGSTLTMTCFVRHSTVRGVTFLQSFVHRWRALRNHRQEPLNRLVHIQLKLQCLAR